MSAATTAVDTSAADAPVSVKTWLAVVGATLGAFLAVLNIQIVSSSLADIQGALGAGIDEGGWVSTSYLVTEIIVIPLSGWLATVFSIRRYLLVNTALFLIFSVACAFAQNLGQMIVLRAIQGFAGGVLIPMAFTIIITKLPPARRPIGIALFAISATFAPAIGPTIGGYLNDNYGWEFIFYANLVPGLIMLAMLWYALEPSPMQLGLLKKGDWAGILTLAVGLGTLQTVLEEGNKDDWFGSDFIFRLSIVAAVSLLAFLVIELRAKNPVINLRLLKERNFGLGTFAAFLLGTALYGSSYVLPLYLSQIQGYNAQQIGEVLAWTGIPQLAVIPFVPYLMKRFDARILVAIGFGLFAASNFMNIYLTKDVAADQLLWPNLVRALGQAVLLTPLTAIATAGIAAKDAGSASGIYNMTRNLGGAIGIAALQTIISKREQFHSNILTPHVSLFEQATRTRLEQLQQYFLSHGISDPQAAWHQAVVAIGRVVRQQAFVQAYADAFFLMGAALAVALVAALFFRRGSSAGGAGAH